MTTLENPPEDCGVNIIYKDVTNNINLHDESTAIGKKYKIAKKLCESIYTIELNESEECNE